jgi:hypothetical protein
MLMIAQKTHEMTTFGFRKPIATDVNRENAKVWMAVGNDPINIDSGFCKSSEKNRFPLTGETFLTIYKESGSRISRYTAAPSTNAIIPKSNKNIAEVLLVYCIRDFSILGSLHNSDISVR